MTKHILITGASGFLGQQILKELAVLDLELTVVVRTRSRIQGTLSSRDIKTISTHDLFNENLAWWEKHCHGVDTIIHTAWFTEPGKYFYSPLNLECLKGSLTLTQGAIRAGIRRFIGIGTCFEYDLSVGLLNTETALKPTTLYAATKAALFLALQGLLPTFSVEFAWCRLFYLFGEGEDSRRLNSYIREQLSMGQKALLTSGDQVRDYLDVSVAAAAIAKVALGNQCGALNICSGVPQTVRKFAESIASEYGRPDLLNFGARESNPTDPPFVLGVPSAIDI